MTVLKETFVVLLLMVRGPIGNNNVEEDYWSSQVYRFINSHSIRTKSLVCGLVALAAGACGHECYSSITISSESI